MKDLNQRLEEIRTALSPSFDIVYRHVTIQNTQAWLIFLSSLSDSELIASLVEGFVITAGNDLHITFYPGAIDKLTDRKKAITNMLSGQSGADGYQRGLLLHRNPALSCQIHC